MDVENIKPYSPAGESKTEQVRQMFDNIAPAYDFMNRAMTLGIDRCWRREAVKAVATASPRAVLDVATGTGDFAIQIARSLPSATVSGIDLSEGMLAVARDKVSADDDLSRRVTFASGDCLALPYADDTFDAVTVAFGVRNFESLERGYQEMARVLRPGGILAVLELSTPRNRLIRWFYDLYTLHIIPWAGSLKSGDSEAYRYLPRSIAAVPQGDDMLALMRAAGFTDSTARHFTFGTCTLYSATLRPATDKSEH